MSKDIELRRSLPTDREALEYLYPAAFPDENLIPLLRDLLDETDGVFSCVAISDGELVGHVVFTMCHVDEGGEKVGLLGPVAVSPAVQRQGIGSALIEDGLNWLKSEGAVQAYVLGDPAYYGRFGFEADSTVKPPYDLPEEWLTAWQSLGLQGAKPDCHGRLSVPEPWRKPALWGP